MTIDPKVLGAFSADDPLEAHVGVEISSFLDGILLSGDIVVRSALDERN